MTLRRSGLSFPAFLPGPARCPATSAAATTKSFPFTTARSPASAAAPRAIGKAFGLQSKTTQFDLLCTAQIGSWSSDTVPVILTIQWNGHELPAVIAELALRLKRPFILLSPTNTHLTAHCQELLAHAD